MRICEVKRLDGVAVALFDAFGGATGQDGLGLVQTIDFLLAVVLAHREVDRDEVAVGLLGGERVQGGLQQRLGFLVRDLGVGLGALGVGVRGLEVGDLRLQLTNLGGFGADLVVRDRALGFVAGAGFGHERDEFLAGQLFGGVGGGDVLLDLEWNGIRIWEYEDECES